MTEEQIEAKALEEFPDRAGDDKTILATLSSAFSEARREGFIKGCQYAATPSAEINVLFDDIMLSVRQLSLFAGKSGANVTYRLIEALKHLQAASLSPAQPIRPAESPDAGREHPHTAALREIETLPTGDPFHAMVKSRQIARKALAHVPVTNVGDIPAGRKGFKAELSEKMYQLLLRLKISKPERDVILNDWENERKITPADPGSQVEAGKFAEWASQNGWSYHGANAMWYSSRTHECATAADLITLYKQSL